MATLAKLIVKLITDVSEFEAGAKAAQKKLTKIGDEMSKVGDTMSKYVTLPILAAGAASLKFASDLEETKNKTAVIFGDMTDQVMKFNQNSARDFGMSKNAALTYVSTYGSILTNMGLTDQAAADMSMGLQKLTADYASFHNLKPEEAFEKIKAGMVGSSEPLISLGKDLREGAVQAYALENGITQNAKAMTNSEKALARYGLLMQQSGKEAGDFARTADGLANSSRIVQASFEDILASFGETLIPVAIQFMQALIPILTFFNGLPTPVKSAIVYFLLFAAALGPVLSAGGRVVSLFGTVSGLFAKGGALAGAGAWITGTLVPAITAGSGALTSTLIPAIVAVGLPIIALIAAFALLIVVIKNFGGQALGTIKTIGQIFGLLPKLIEAQMKNSGAAIQNGLREAANWVMSRGADFYRAGQALMSGLINGIISYAVYVVQVVMRVVTSVINAVKQALGIASPSKVFQGYGQNMMLGMQRGIEQFSARPVLATVQAAEAVLPAAQAVQPGGRAGRSLSVGPITINGDLSESMKEKLKAEMKSLFIQVMEEALA